MSLLKVNIKQIDTTNISDSSIAAKTETNLVQDNVAGAISTAAANDYATYNTLSSSIDTVQANLTSLVGAAPSTLDTLAEIAAALENDANLAVTLTTSIGSVQSNVTTLTSTTAANDYSTYTTLSGLIDTVQDNVASAGGSGNTTLYVGDTAIANSAIIVEAGSGISVSGNSTAHTLSISASMSNASAQVIPIDGSANTFSTIKAAANNNMVLVIYNGIVQDHTKYSWSDTDLTLANTDPLTAGSNVEVRYFDFFDLPGVASGGGGGAYTFQGTVSGYISGGSTPVSPGFTASINKFSFTSDGNATNVGNITESKNDVAGQSSITSGYSSGGANPNATNVIDKFPFASDGNATDVGDLSQARLNPAGQSSITSGYTSGGGAPANSNVIDKFPFSADSNASDVGDLTVARSIVMGQSSTDSGYTSGGLIFNTIDKFPFSSDSNATDVGDLTSSMFGGSGQSSTESGYISGSRAPTFSPTNTDIIEKFPFATDTNTSDVGDLTQTRYGPSGQSSSTSGYASGGFSNVIDKFPFAADANATDVGDLIIDTSFSAGQQV